MKTFVLLFLLTGSITPFWGQSNFIGPDSLPPGRIDRIIDYTLYQDRPFGETAADTNSAPDSSDFVLPQPPTEKVKRTRTARPGGLLGDWPGQSPGTGILSEQLPCEEPTENDCCDNLRANYHELRHNPPTGNTSILTDPGVRGVFHRASSGILDGATGIRDINGYWWQRVHDPGVFKLAWWPVGTKVNNNDSIASAADAMALIMELHGGGVTIDLRTESGPRLYSMDRPVPLQAYTRIIGNGDTLQRYSTPVAIITAAADASEQWISVSSTQGFLQGQYLSVTRGRSLEDVVIVSKKINGIESNQLKVQGQLGKAIAVGDTVFVSTTMFTNGYGVDMGDIYFEGVIFDGNWRNNPYTNAWTINRTVALSSNMGSRFSADRCGFFDLPSENIVSASGYITNSHFKRLAGSIYHVSVLPDTAMNIYIENCWADSICLAGNDVTGHSEAAVLTSASPANITLVNCDFSNGREGLVGDLGGAVDFISIRDGKFRNFKRLVFGGTGADNVGGEITGNYFENCGVLAWSNGLNGDDLTTRDWSIHHNEFINTKMDIRGSKSILIDHNSFRYDLGLGGFDNLDPTADSEFPAMVHFASVRNLVFSDNLLIGSTQYLENLQHGILFSSQSTTDSLFIWERDIFIKGNTLRHFHKSISTVNTPVPQAGNATSVREHYYWEISDNEITMLSDPVPVNWGIYAAPGVLVQGNTIQVTHIEFPESSFPIIAIGIPYSPTNPKDDYLIGALILQNTVLGRRSSEIQRAVFIDPATSVGEGEFIANVVCIGNLLFAPIALPQGPFHRCQIESNQILFPKRTTYGKRVPQD